MGLLSGLESLGLGKMKEEELYEKEAPKNPETGAPVAPQKSESDVLLDRTFKCVVCGKEFQSKTIKAGKNKLVKQELDLRATYDMADAVKYDPIVCPHCGYATLTRFIKQPLPSAMEKLVREKICANFKGLPQTGEIYSYDDAILRYKLVLASTVAKCGKDSEKAYVCLKMGWAIRGKAESLPEDTPNKEAVLKQLKAEELECLKNAYEGFNSAFSKEAFPMCGMDENTVMYLCAELARRIGKLDEAARLASSIITSRSAGERMKDRAREVKELIKKQKEAAAEK